MKSTSSTGCKCSVEPVARQIRPQAERYIAARLALSDHSPSIFLFATMEADPTKAYNHDDATGGDVELSLRLNRSRRSLDATLSCLKVAAKVQRKR